MTNYIYGLHATKAAIGQQKILRAFSLSQRQDGKLQEILTALKTAKVRIEPVDRATLDHLVNYENHQGIVLEVDVQQQYHEGDIEILLSKRDKPQVILVLDGVQDPHNLGACLRSADALGVSLVLAPKDNAVGLTPVVRKIACGAAETIPFIQVTNLARSMKKLQDLGFWFYGLAGDAEHNFFDADLNGNIALVLGAEGKGLRQLTQKTCDVLYHIPMLGSVSSLNVSVATGICLAEAMRQRLVS